MCRAQAFTLSLVLCDFKSEACFNIAALVRLLLFEAVLSAASFNFLFKHHPACFRLYWWHELLWKRKWKALFWSILLVAAASWMSSIDGRGGGWVLASCRTTTTVRFKLACVFLCTCLNLYACGSTSCSYFLFFFFLSPPAACVRRFMLYVRLSNDAPCYVKQHHPFKDMIPHIHVWLQHLLNIQPLVPGTSKSFNLFCF